MSEVDQNIRCPCCGNKMEIIDRTPRIRIRCISCGMTEIK